MPLRILHVLSSNFFSGAVAYSVALAKKQIADGHHVYMVTDNDELLDMPSVHRLPVSDRRAAQRYKNIRFLRNMIHTQEIHVVHAHSRAASWVAHFAVRGSNVPLVSTIHGRQIKNSVWKKHDVYGEQIIAVCSNLAEHLRHEMGFDPKKIATIPNGIDVEHLSTYKRNRPNGGSFMVSVIGRFNGLKGEVIARLVEEVFPILLEKHPGLSIRLIGGQWEEFPGEGKRAYEVLRLKFGERIQHLEFIREILQTKVNSDLVIGAGRVAAAGVMLGIPVFAIGEACCHGILNQSNISAGIASSFGDILPTSGPWKLDVPQALKELSECVDGNIPNDCSLPGALSAFGIQKVALEIMQTYRRAMVQKVCPGTIPVLMYHRVPDAPINTQHQTFVTRQNFRKHLRFFKLRRLTSITFKDYDDFVNGRKNWSTFPRRPFILTFDDGYDNNYSNMLPLTREYGFTGVLFLLGDFSASANFWDEGEEPDAVRLMSTVQKRAFVAGGWEIGAHTFSHPDLTKLDDEQARREIQESKTCIEKELNTSIVSFAYPYGNCDERTKRLVRESGYEFGIATDSGGNTIEDDRLQIFRVNMFPGENAFQLYKKTSSWYRAYYRRKRGK
jgi:peptidoglycan/xylan/chitin deacetylase (PgdA/CDA1 family)